METQPAAIGADSGCLAATITRAQCNSIGTDGRRMDSARQETHTAHTHVTQNKGCLLFWDFLLWPTVVNNNKKK